jgi:hypothetical protein
MEVKDLTRAFKSRKTGKQVRAKLQERIVLLEANPARPDYEDLEWLRMTYRNIEDQDLFVLSMEQCFELGF